MLMKANIGIIKFNRIINNDRDNQLISDMKLKLKLLVD